MSVPSHIKAQSRLFNNKDVSQMPTVAVSTVTPPPSSSSKKRRGKPFSLRTKMLLLVMLVALLIPTLIILVQGFYIFLIYNQVRDGLTHLQNVQQAFGSDAQGDSAKYFNIDNLRKAQQEIDAAHGDFVAVRNSLDSSGAISMYRMMLPQQMTTARSLSHIGVDATEIMQQLIKSAIKLAPTIGPALASSPAQKQDDPGPTVNPAVSLKPVLTSEGFDEVMADLNIILPLLRDMNKYVPGVSLNSLPLSASQQQLLSGVLLLLPQAEVLVQQAISMKDDVRWLLGIDQAHNFLVEPMDSGELRATGGFTGQFGLLTINGGNLQSPKFRNIGVYEEDLTDLGTPLSPIFTEKVAHQKPPAPYDAWWPIANFGLRDANISVDFPTSAQMMMKTYTYEFGVPVDGVITFTPFLIEHILTVTGPLTIPEYNETITSQNLIERLHYYQLDNTGIRKAEIIEHEEDSQIARKLFTGRVTSALISAVQHLPMNKLQSMIQMIFSSMKSKDLQIYVTNPQLESLISKYGSTNALNRSTDKDGLFIVQSNLSASKASTYVNTTINDTITLDPSGSATHKMQVTLDYQQKGSVYGFDTYRDYVRVYVPQGSQYLSGNGFDQYQPWCGSDAGLQACPSDVYGDGTLICPANTTAGYATWHLYDPFAFKIHPIDRVGSPTNRTSDESGRDMYGGWAVVPKNCTLTFTLSWISPPATGNHLYSFLIQRQASTFPKVNLTIYPAPGTCKAPLQYSGTMGDQDQLFTISNESACKLRVTNADSV